MPLPRTTQDIQRQIQALSAPGQDPHGIERSRLLDALPWSEAQGHLTDAADYDQESWKLRQIEEPAHARRQIVEYFPHAWRKANSCKLGSVCRALAHYRGLLFLLGPSFDGLRLALSDPDPEEDHYYGKRQMVALADAFDEPWKELDSGKWFPRTDADPVSPESVL